jgi:rod shape-determining protein MreD
LLLIVAVIQTTIVPHLAVWGVFADLPVLVVVSWSLLHGAREGLLWGFVSGLAVDILSAAPFGAATLSLLVVGLIAGLGQATAFRTHFLMPLVTILLATIIFDSIYLLVLQVSGQPVAWLNTIFRLVLPSAALNMALTPVVYGIMRWLSIRHGQTEMEW